MGNCAYQLNRKEALRRNLTITSQSKKKYLTITKSLSNDNLADTRPEFTEHQKELVLESWNIVHENMDGVGVQMFLRLIELHPEVQDAFMPFNGLPLAELHTSNKLRSHAHRVMNTVNKCLECIDDQATFERLLEELGSRHAMYTAKVDYIDLVGPQFISAVEAVSYERWTLEMEQAWSDLFKLIAHVMKGSMKF